MQRQSFDSEAYIRRIQTGPCFICEMVKGNSEGNHVVYQDKNAIVFLNKYPTLYGYTIVAPVEHHEQVTGDSPIDEYLDLQRVVYSVSEAVRQEFAAERVYILSLGSHQGNAHVHWHIAPLPPGVPFEEQQLAALGMRQGILQLPEAEMAEIAARLARRLHSTLVPGIIRGLAICLFQRDGQILVAEYADPVKRENFYRPLGGSIQFGERGEAAVVREIREEIGAEACDLRYLGTIENIYTYRGAAGHELALVYDGRLADEALYRRPEIAGKEDNGWPFKAVWKSLDDFQPDKPPLYPDGLLEFLQKRDSSASTMNPRDSAVNADR